MTDQFRADCIGLDPHSPDALQTPNLDWMAQEVPTFAGATAKARPVSQRGGAS